MATKAKEKEISVLEVTKGVFDVCILGTSPLICNRMSQKVIQQLLLPPAKKTASDKASTLKHDPVQEFQDSPYRSDDKANETLIQLMATAFKGAMRTAALDMPGSTKSQMGRLTYIPGQYINIFGIPKLFMSITRMADVKRTPDVRTRVIIPEWACRLTVEYTKPILKEQVVVNLLAASGVTMGVGDWRPEKGSGTFGQFKLVLPTDKDFKRVIKTGDRAVQVRAMDEPECYDAETEELLSWFDAEVRRRGFKVAS